MRALLPLLMPLVALAQPAPAGPAFEVTSVKPVARVAGPLPPAGCSPETGRFVAPARAVWFAITYAYDIELYQLSPLTAWPGARDLYDIEGKAPGPITDSQCRLMVRALLADRFKLQVHRETRTLPVLALIVGKNGAKLQKVTDSDAAAGTDAATSPATNKVIINGVPAYEGAKGWTMRQFATFLSRTFPGQTVVDDTGLEGFYPIKFDFEVQPPNPPGDAVRAEIQRQLGLKIEERKEPVEMLVIANFAPPDRN